MDKELNFAKIVMLFMVIFNIMGAIMILEYNSFIDVLLPVNAIIILGYYLEKTATNLISVYLSMLMSKNVKKEKNKESGEK